MLLMMMLLRKVLPGFEPGSLDSKSKMLTNYTTEPSYLSKVSILGLPGYGPGTLPLSYRDILTRVIRTPDKWIYSPLLFQAEL